MEGQDQELDDDRIELAGMGPGGQGGWNLPGLGTGGAGREGG